MRRTFHGICRTNTLTAQRQASGDSTISIPHSYPNHYVRQQYLPDILKDKVYYRFGDNRQEQAAAAYREKILREDKTGGK